MADKKDKKSDNIEREYVIPLRPKFQHVARYKKTPKAVKTIKEFLVKHMKVYDRDLNKIKLDKYVNELLWIDGIKNPPHKIKVKAVKEGDVFLVDLSKLGYTKLLGTGTVFVKLKLNIARFTPRAEEKIKAAGGEVGLSEKKE